MQRARKRVVTGGTLPQNPVRLSDVLVLERRGASNRCQWLRGRLSHSSATNRQTAVVIVADAAVKWQCRGAVHHYTSWSHAITENTRLSADESRRLAPFMKPAFGLPGSPLPLDTVQGHVAEYVWYILAQENFPARPNSAGIEGPSFSVTTPRGGRAGGLSTRRRSSGVPPLGDQEA